MHSVVKLSTINYQLKKMNNKEIWSKVLHVVITVLTAIATTLLIYYNMFIFL